MAVRIARVNENRVRTGYLRRDLTDPGAAARSQRTVRLSIVTEVGRHSALRPTSVSISPLFVRHFGVRIEMRPEGWQSCGTSVGVPCALPREARVGPARNQASRVTNDEHPAVDRGPGQAASPWVGLIPGAAVASRPPWATEGRGARADETREIVPDWQCRATRSGAPIESAASSPKGKWRQTGCRGGATSPWGRSAASRALRA